MAAQLIEGACLRGAVGNGVGPRVVAVRLEVLDRPLRGGVAALTRVLTLHRESGAVQVVVGVVGPRYAPWPKIDPYSIRPLLRNTFCPASTSPLVKEDPAGRVDHLRRNGRVFLIGLVGEDAKDEEAEEDDH